MRIHSRRSTCLILVLSACTSTYETHSYGAGTGAGASESNSSGPNSQEPNATQPSSTPQASASPQPSMTPQPSSSSMPSGSSVVFYVSPFGNDNNLGTSPDAAWQSLDKVNAGTFAAGTIIQFDGSQTYLGSLALANLSGDANAPIVLTSDANGPATIVSGGLRPFR